jgi:hypothetical protein
MYYTWFPWELLSFQLPFFACNHQHCIHYFRNSK